MGIRSWPASCMLEHRICIFVHDYIGRGFSRITAKKTLCGAFVTCICEFTFFGRWLLSHVGSVHEENMSCKAFSGAV